MEQDTDICFWANQSETLKHYHNTEWGVPIHDDKKLFEVLMLEVMSCGLNWDLILRNRNHLNKAFDNFEPSIVAQYDEKKVNELMQDPGIIRHKGKILAVVNNAKAFLRLTEHTTFDAFPWKYVSNEPVVHTNVKRIVSDDVSDQIAKDLQNLGFKFLGSVSIYAYMQSIGMVNDHLDNCKYKYRN